MEQIVATWCDNDERITELSKELRDLRKEQKEIEQNIVQELSLRGTNSLITSRGKKLEVSSKLKKVKK